MKAYTSAFSILVTFILLTTLTSTGCQRRRIETGTHPNGNMMFEIEYRGEMKHGTSTFFFQDGRKEAEYHYQDDALDGTASRWYFNGNLEFEEEYKNDLLHGTSRNYYITGTLSTERHYNKGVLHGDYREYWENGEIKASGQYEHGWWEGDWIYYDPQGIQVGQATFSEGNGVLSGFHRNGVKSREVHYLNNQKHGAEIIYDESGKKTKELRYQIGRLVDEIIF
jgi:antitoxin component YwqK of YwqJK toxin-antitoxin module